MNELATYNEREEQSCRRIINNIAGHYLSDQDVEENHCEDFYDAYKVLCEKSREGYGEERASEYVNVWEPLDTYTVDQIIDLIESAQPEVPEFIQNIDWELLKEQKLSLLDLVNKNNESLTDKQIDALDGIIGLIDSLQDSAVDDYGFEEERVFGKSTE